MFSIYLTCAEYDCREKTIKSLLRRNNSDKSMKLFFIKTSKDSDFSWAEVIMRFELLKGLIDVSELLRYVCMFVVLFT